jgi:hypothetical protein
MNSITTLWIVVALALLLCLGYGVLNSLAPTLALAAGERWAVAYLLGTGGGAILWFLLSPIYRAVSPRLAITVVALGIGLYGHVRRPAYPPPDRSEGSSLAERMLMGLFIIQSAAMIVAAMRTPLGWDAVFNFEIKARLALENSPRGQLPLSYLSDASRSWSHPQYPLVVPFAELWVYSWLGHVDQMAIKILFPLFYLCLIAMMCGAVRRVAGGVPAVGCAIALGLLPPMTLQPGAVSGYADVPLAAAFAGAVSLTMLGVARGRRDAIWLAAALSAVAAWTKTEGIVLAISLGLTALAARLFAERSDSQVSVRVLASLVYVPLLVIGPWLWLQQAYGQRAGDFDQISLATTSANLHRLPGILTFVGAELLRPGHWATLWPAFVASLWIMIRTRNASSSDWLMAGSVVMPLVAYSLVFVYSAWPDVRNHMTFSLSRLLVSLAPIALMFAISQIWPHRRSAAWA